MSAESLVEYVARSLVDNPDDVTPALPRSARER